MTFIGVMPALDGANVQKFARNKIQASLWHSLRLSSSLPWPLNGNSRKQVYVYCQGCNPETPDLWPVSLFHRGNNELIQEMCLLSKKNSDRMNHLSYSLVWYWRFVLRSPWTCTESKFKMGKELAPPLLPDITKTICSKLFDVQFCEIIQQTVLNLLIWGVISDCWGIWR